MVKPFILRYFPARPRRLEPPARGLPGHPHARELPAQAVHIALGTGHRGLQFGHTVQIALVVAGLDTFLLRLAVRIGFLRLGQTLFGLAKLGLQNLARIAVTRSLLRRVAAWRRFRRRRGGRGCCRARSGLRRRALDDGDVAALHGLAALGLGHRGVVGVFVPATVDALLGQGRRQARSRSQQGQRFPGINNGNGFGQHRHSRRPRAQTSAFFSMAEKLARYCQSPDTIRWLAGRRPKKRTAGAVLSG